MSRFLARRAVEIVLVLAIMSFVIYALIGLMPGDPIDLMISADPHLTAADAMRLKALYGLDQPLAERYWAWLKAALTGDFGYSRLYVRPALQVLLPRLGNTALLMGLSFALTLAIAWPLGILASRRPGSVFDNAVNLFSFAAISVPSFWLALMLILVFAAALGWLPAGGMETIGDGGFTDRARHLVLPVLTLTLVNLGPHLRYMRASMIETLHQDYIRTARAKGAGEARILLHHALRNALIPVVTVVAFLAAFFNLRRELGPRGGDSECGGAGFASRLPYPHHHRRFAFRHRHRRHGPRDPAQRAGDERQGGGSGGRCQYPAPG